MVAKVWDILSATKGWLKRCNEGPYGYKFDTLCQFKQEKAADKQLSVTVGYMLRKIDD